MVGKFFTASGLIGLMLFIISTTIVGCDKEKSPEFVEMTFVIPIEATPIRSLNIGDTLWISADFPDTILDLNSMKYYKIINMDFKELLGLRKLSSNELTISEQPGALESFSFFKNSATLFNIGGTFADLKFSYSNERYSFKLGIIPKATGIFCVNFLWPIQLNDGFDEGLNLKNYIDLGLTIDGRRRVPIHKATYVVINNGETNFDLFEANCRAISLEVPIEGNIYYEQKGTFTFEVVQ